MCTNPMLMYMNRHTNKPQIKYDPRECDLSRTFWVSCGKCEECKRARRSNYTVRARAEYQKYGSQRCFLLNLTVNDECLDKVFPDGSLDHYEFQCFMKRLRKKLQREYGANAPKIKYICGAEYGEQNGRPHFHILIYGWKPEDLKKWTNTKKGYKQYRSKFVEECWKDTSATKRQIKAYNKKHNTDLDYLPLGFVTLGEVYDSSVAYVTKYVVKNADVKAEDFEVNGVCVRKPYVVFPHVMLGYEWFCENYRDILGNGYCTTKYGKCAVPKNWIRKGLECGTPDMEYMIMDFLDKREIYFKQLCRELKEQGYITKDEQYMKVWLDGQERLKTYNNMKLKGVYKK